MDGIEYPTSCRGRNMELGTLYDCRSDTVISGSIWSAIDIKKHRETSVNETSSFKFVSEDEMTAKTSVRKLDGSLSLSIYDGLANGNGAANYLQTVRNSESQASVVLQYLCRSGREKLDFGNISITNRELISEGRATHVVVDVDFGADALFIFSKHTANSNERERAEANIAATIANAIPDVQGGDIHAGATASKTESTSKSQISCSFYGDGTPTKIPCTFEDAIRRCESLPETIANKTRQDSVLYGFPKTVVLYPLERLTKRRVGTESLGGRISLPLMKSITNYLNDFKSNRSRIERLQISSICAKIHPMREKVRSFRLAMGTLLETFEHELNLVQSGEKDEHVLGTLMKQIDAGPFRIEALKLWIDNISTELSRMDSVDKSFTRANVSFVNEEELHGHFGNNAIRNVVVLTLANIVHEEDDDVCAMKLFLETFPAKDPTEPIPPVYSATVKKKWFHNPNIQDPLNEKIDLFCKFSKVNKQRTKHTKCVCVLQSLDKDDKPGTIYLYPFVGKREAFDVPSAPIKPSVTKDFFSRDYIIKWSSPIAGQKAVKRYRIWYKRLPNKSRLGALFDTNRTLFNPMVSGVANMLSPDSSLEFNEEWDSRLTSKDETFFNHRSLMSAEYEYYFKISAVTDAGESPDSPTVVFDPKPLLLSLF